jgi:hypothetical protein
VCVSSWNFVVVIVMVLVVLTTRYFVALFPGL